MRSPERRATHWSRILQLIIPVLLFLAGLIHPIESFDWTGTGPQSYARCMMATEDVMDAMGPDEVSVLHRVSRIVSSELSLDEMLGEIVSLAAQITGCAACLVYLAETETNEFVLRASL